MFDWVLNTFLDTKVDILKILSLISTYYMFHKPSILLKCNSDNMQEKITN